MTITLQSYQEDGVQFLREQIVQGGDMEYSAVTGAGKSIVLAEAIRGIPRVAYLMGHPGLGRQFATICENMLVTNVAFMPWRMCDPTQYDLIIVCESLVGMQVIVDHPRVIRVS
jgi:hypothetical protein